MPIMDADSSTAGGKGKLTRFGIISIPFTDGVIDEFQIVIGVVMATVVPVRKLDESDAYP
jgi:hypothetical protein